METFAGALKFVLPIFFLLMIIELIAAKVKKKNVINSMDAVSSLSSGLTNTLFKILGVTIYLLSYDFLLKHIVIFKVESKALEYIIGFLVIDLYVYWWHRWRHEYNILWNEHLIHHSSEEYNLPVALRQTVTDFINPATFLLAPAAMFGVSLETLTILGVVMLFGGFWYHTEMIGKMGFLEYFLVTPSHHRIHHAINPIYIDKNYGGILIIWDKMFGTFQEELDDVKPVYGLTRQVNTWNPIKINFLHIGLLFKDAWRTNNVWDKFRIWFMPTGWRPTDVIEKYPIPYISDPSQQHKYRPEVSLPLKIWAWIQLTITFMLMMFLMMQVANIGKTALFVYAFFIFFSVFCYTSLMDKNRYAWIFEIIRFITVLVILKVYSGWFTLDIFVPNGTFILMVYFSISVIVSLAFEFLEFKQESKVDEATL